MRLQSLLVASLIPAVTLAAPCGADAIVSWTSRITKSVSWFRGDAPLAEQLLVATPFEERTIFDVLKSRDEFSKLVKYIEEDKDLVDLLSDKQRGMTLFAPNNEALERDCPHSSQCLGGNDKDRRHQFIRDIAHYHMLPQVVEYNQFGRNSTLATELHAKDGSFGGHRRRLTIQTSVLPPWKVTINYYVGISESDIRAVNGIIHKIDMPIPLPLDIMDCMFMFPSEFSITSTALMKIALQQQYEFNSDFSKKGHHHNDRHGRGTPVTTLFVPTNDAWNKLPEDLVFYLFSPWGEQTLRKLLAFHTIPSGIVLSEWARLHQDGDEVVVKDEDDDLSFEWDHHFPSLTSQKLPVHSKKSKTLIPGSHVYNIEFMAHGIPVKFVDGVAQNGAVHVIDDVLSPKRVEGGDSARNAEEWKEWKDWLFNWTEKTDEVSK